jgi:hypothetical protein
MDSYADQERLLWEQLSGLVTDAAWLESYAGAAMLKVKETMQVRSRCLGMWPVAFFLYDYRTMTAEFGASWRRFRVGMPSGVSTLIIMLGEG